MKTRTNTRPYVGFRDGTGEWEAFRSPKTPTDASHGSRYFTVIGPFRTMRAAKYMAQYGRGNPHLTSVADAERAVKQEA